jgi:probable F420-dependent oxidoreductase
MTISAGLGLAHFPFSSGRAFWRWVDLCESGGVDSIWQSDRLVSPIPNLEVMSVMAALAGGTKRIKFGMNVASLGHRDPFLTAKACATIDVLSEGRLLPAFGVGTARSDDYRARGVPTQGRGKRSAEALEIISKLWAEGTVTFKGTYYQYENATLAPQPVQRNLPLWVGGSAPAAIERTARWGTGWQAGLETPEEIAPVITAIKDRAAALGRTIDEDHYGAGFAFRFGSPEDPVARAQGDALRARLGDQAEAMMAVGDSDVIMERLLAYHAAGAHKFILRPMAQDDDDMMVQTARLIKEVLPRVEALNQAAAA